MKGLVKKEREQIFRLFTEHAKLKFNEIEKALKIRSNMVSYHLEKMQQEDLLRKEGDYYSLTKKAERYLPILPHIIGQELSPLPIVLAAVTNDDRILLMKRNNRPYQNYWSLVGGKMKLEEDFKEASKRLVKEKTNLDADYKGIAGILHERVEGEKIIKYSFILFFVKMETNDLNFEESSYGKLKWFKISELEKEKVIPSDL